MAAVDLCTFNHGLGIYIRILSLAFVREKIIEYKCPTHGLNEHKSTAAMNYFLNNTLYNILKAWDCDKYQTNKKKKITKLQ